MLISIIAIFYNSEIYVEKCIDSILRQKGNFDIELIAVDDNSKDATLNKLEKLAKNDKRIKIVKHLKNKGISAARNSGTDIATGDAVFYIDGDDYLPNDALNQLAKQFTPDIDIVQGSFSIVDESGNLITTRSYKDAEFHNKEQIRSRFNELEFAYIHNRLINKRIIDKGIRFQNVIIQEDRIWNIEVFPYLNKVVNTSALTYCYVQRSSSFSYVARIKDDYIDASIKVVELIDSLNEPCWKGMRDSMIISNIEGPLYLTHRNKKYRRKILDWCRCQNISLSPNLFARYKNINHRLIQSGMPECFIALFSKIYVFTCKKLKRPM